MQADGIFDASRMDQWMGNDMSVDHPDIDLMGPDLLKEPFNR